MDAGAMAMGNEQSMGGGMGDGMSPQAQVAPGQAQVDDPQKILDALRAAIQQTVNAQGYVDMNKLILLWPQIAQKFGIDVPFQTVLQLLEQNPDIFNELVTQYGLAGIIANGQVISAQQMLAQAGGGGGMTMGG